MSVLNSSQISQTIQQILHGFEIFNVPLRPVGFRRGSQQNLEKVGLRERKLNVSLPGFWDSSQPVSPCEQLPWSPHTQTQRTN